MKDNIYRIANVILKIDETLFTELSIVFSAAMSVLTVYKATGDLPQNSIRTDSSLPVMVLITTVLTFSGG